MRRLSIVILFAMTAITFASPTSEKNVASERSELASSFEHFSSQFYKHTAAANQGRNLVMSPLSAHIALALLSIGAEGETLDEINSALQLKNKEFTESAFRATMKKFNDSQSHGDSKASDGIEPPTLRVVNKVYVMDKYTMAPKFVSVAKDAFLSEAESLNFAESGDAAKTINTWVENKTNNKIKHLVSPNDVNADTRMAIVNAVYFKGSWKHPFDPLDTVERDFFIAENQRIRMDMMTTTALFKVAKIPEWDAKMIELPFAGDDVSMLIVLPDRIYGLEMVERRIAHQGFEEVSKKLRLENVHLRIPKFNISTRIDLKRVLPELGISKIFGKDAELGGLLTSPERLYVSQAVQKAFIEVNEYGCEAAAATAVLPALESLDMTLFVDRPFFYTIVGKDGAVYFKGRVVDSA